jgi:hypothetical protein
VTTEAETIELAWMDYRGPGLAGLPHTPALMAQFDAFTAGYRACQAAAPRWIAVGERMPETGERVIMQVHCGGICFGCWFADERRWNDIETDGCNDSIWYEREQVTHWRPLPEPPR